jgi:hypothetical protein
MPLVIDREVLCRTQVLLLGQALRLGLGESEDLVPEVGEIGDPTHLLHRAHGDREARFRHNEALLSGLREAAAALTHGC